jgi:hypothetical protein
MDSRQIYGRPLKDKLSVCKSLIIGALYLVRDFYSMVKLPVICDLKSYVLGDPMDSSIKLRPLEPAAGQALARDLVLKTRRRKGLGDQISVSKYLDDEFVVSTES